MTNIVVSVIAPRHGRACPAIHVFKSHQRKMWMPRGKLGHDGSADFFTPNVMSVVSSRSERNASVGIVKSAAGARGYIISQFFRF
jgi:hypothetical protein